MGKLQAILPFLIFRLERSRHSYRRFMRLLTETSRREIISIFSARLGVSHRKISTYMIGEFGKLGRLIETFSLMTWFAICSPRYMHLRSWLNSPLKGTTAPMQSHNESHNTCSGYADIYTPCSDLPRDTQSSIHHARYITLGAVADVLNLSANKLTNAFSCLRRVKDTRWT